ncbi:DUF1624 domain-containing protein [Alteromonas pelagimontana]|uniref:DUF1624 domain-containing protein n=1 Tax=Alteromonas pelagimontana TaxID=1858656 RepID=A0A6M4ME68_9ALTE|nr:heparan-alpha-glucosaminide N-acetyltransferase domain-containing protein [Alteromonas pelagimontana]QJR80456.1 DUF1624 domain-containing protein [Alteromonas pelagimontana]
MKRESSLDIFRGFTLAAMILVNTPGSWSYVYAPLLHSHWHGLTPTDLIFPFFLFIVGAAMFFSLSRQPKSQIPWLKIVKRTALLFFIGMSLNFYPFTSDIDNWRIMGVLQRIALCYCLGAIIIILFSDKGIWLATAVLMIGYFGVMLTQSPAWTLENNLVRDVDLYLLGASHMYKGFGLPFDPEGLLSCIPATATLLLGYLTSSALSHHQSAKEKIKQLAIWAIIALALGLAWHQWQPINKPLWTGSYVLVTAACGWITLAVIVFFNSRNWGKGVFSAAQIFGSNPLFIYILSWLFAATLQQVIRFKVDGKDTNAYEMSFTFLSSVMSPYNASLVFALLVVALHFLVALWLYRRKIFIKL